MTYQLGSSMLEAVVLSIVSEEDTYGYLISQRIKSVVNLKESTLYPVLRKLQENGYLETYDHPYQGRNRRYYKITMEGKLQRKFYFEEWQKYKEEIDKILKLGDGENE